MNPIPPYNPECEEDHNVNVLTTTSTTTTSTVSSMPTNPSTMLAKLKAWELANPLRAWRTENGVSRQTVAGALGVTHTAVVAWEAGSNRPTGDNMESIARLMGLSAAKLTEAWDNWRSASPAAK